MGAGFIGSRYVSKVCCHFGPVYSYTTAYCLDSHLFYNPAVRTSNADLWRSMHGALRTQSASKFKNNLRNYLGIRYSAFGSYSTCIKPSVDVPSAVNIGYVGSAGLSDFQTVSVPRTGVQFTRFGSIC